MSLKHKTIVAIVATALTCPSALAVEGSDGMFYTSASEGLYASIRARFNTGDAEGANSAIVDDAGSRIGVQGMGEMSHGLEAFYRYELRVPDAGDNVRTGKSFVGLRGDFGEIRLGNHDLVDYDFVSAKTDVTNNGARPTGHGIPASQALHYKSPDFNGLQVGAAFQLDGGGDSKTEDRCFTNAENAENGTGTHIAVPTMTVTVATASDKVGTVKSLDCPQGNAFLGEATVPVNNDPDLDAWMIAANYAFQGFTVGGSYGVQPDEYDLGGGRTEDWKAWGVSASYGQDNWSVATFYSVRNAGDEAEGNDDETDFSLAGTVNVGKSKVIVSHDTRELPTGQDQSASTFEIEYHLNSKAKVWVGYTALDKDDDADAKDDFYLGLRHDF